LTDTASHISVLLAEVIESLAPIQNKTIIDGTFGAGGYSHAFLKAGAGRVVGIDRDPNAQKYVKQFEDYQNKFSLVQSTFGNVRDVVQQQNMQSVDAFVLDLGVSSMQLDERERGFSFMHDGPLDMRMAQEGQSAADVVNSYPETLLAQIIYTLGEDKNSRKIAAAICERRKEKPFATTLELADLISETVPRHPKDKKHPATRTFQAIRMVVNSELEDIVLALAASEDILSAGGILAIVTFHSLEDRIVKRFLNERSGRQGGGSRYAPPVEQEKPTFSLPKGYPIGPSEEELAFNIRARSAKLRVAIRNDAPSRKDNETIYAGPNWHGKKNTQFARKLSGKQK